MQEHLNSLLVLADMWPAYRPIVAERVEDYTAILKALRDFPDPLVPHDVVSECIGDWEEGALAMREGIVRQIRLVAESFANMPATASFAMRKASSRLIEYHYLASDMIEKTPVPAAPSAAEVLGILAGEGFRGDCS